LFDISRALVGKGSEPSVHFEEKKSTTTGRFFASIFSQIQQVSLEFKLCHWKRKQLLDYCYEYLLFLSSFQSFYCSILSASTALSSYRPRVEPVDAGNLFDARTEPASLPLSLASLSLSLLLLIQLPSHIKQKFFNEHRIFASFDQTKSLLFLAKAERPSIKANSILIS